jgi:hypothetical protein
VALFISGLISEPKHKCRYEDQAKKPEEFHRSTLLGVAALNPVHDSVVSWHSVPLPYNGFNPADVTG